VANDTGTHTLEWCVPRFAITWSLSNEFEISFVEGTPEFPTVSNRLIWNEDGLIVISFTTDGNTYLVPSPGSG
jgi:hypothetical protein